MKIIKRFIIIIIQVGNKNSKLKILNFHENSVELEKLKTLNCYCLKIK